MRKIMIALVLCACVILPGTSYAHVVVMDEKASTGAILHITPDDDPIAGETSTIYFDVQSGLLAERSTTVTLTISDDTGEISQVSSRRDGTLITAEYMFPAQGAYTITFTVSSGSTSKIFEHVQRVSRSVSTSALDHPAYTWAEISLIGSSVLFSILCIVGITRRKEIAAQSKM